MSMGIIRQAKPEDIDQLVRLEELCFPEEPWSRQMLLEEIENPQALFCVIEEAADRSVSCRDAETFTQDQPSEVVDGAITAYIIAWIIEPFEAQIGSIAVHPDCRRQGLARRLMNVLFDKCRELSIDEISLEVRVSNASAIALYERYGFVKNGVRKRYYQDGEDAYNMIRTELI